MKTILLMLLLLPLTKSFAQFKDGTKMLTTTVSYLNVGFGSYESSSSGNPSTTSHYSGFQLTPEIAYGKIKNNGLLSFGLGLNWGIQNSKQPNLGATEKDKVNIFGFAPNLSYEKFYLLSGNIYYTPLTRFSIGYNSIKNSSSVSPTVGHIHQISSRLDLNLFSITIARNAHTNFLFRAGGLSLTYDHAKYFSTHDQGLANTSHINNFALTAQLSTITVGIQKIL